MLHVKQGGLGGVLVLHVKLGGWEGYCTAGATVCARTCVTLEHVSSFLFSFFLRTW